MFGMDEKKFERSDYKENVKSLRAIMETSMGDITLELYPDKAPNAVWNFVNLAEGRQDNIKDGPFYDGIIFHRVIDGFMIQAGCPHGMGTGGPGYEFDNEHHPDLKHDSEGVLAMANRGMNTNGSQFYITLAPTPHLDGGYTVFGKVIEGMDTVKAIGKVDINPYNHKPDHDVVIKKVKISRTQD
ncbi:MAG: peptidylprolyl isomerase [Bacteriovoracaceae bacterium]|jgi:cyclophilin family peptidyl-prolyl cis-trans isomerase|nr:peptidyl-prolyl cis-trans isomerase [Halobacteriovoraceae bacterium]MDP7319871.1 peptidylprolyl isomerase [Bacteriovoracaceae bacterium]